MNDLLAKFLHVISSHTAMWYILHAIVAHYSIFHYCITSIDFVIQHTNHALCLLLLMVEDIYL
jgi:hypothetical protein